MAKVSWVESVKADFNWLGVGDVEFFGPTSSMNIGNIVHFVNLHGYKVVRNRIKKFCSTPYANISTQWSSVATSKHVAVEAGIYKCTLCEKTFDDMGTHDRHRYAKHGLKSSIGCHVDGTRCLVCLKEFFTRYRLLSHLRYDSKVCGYNVMLRPSRITEERAKELDNADKSANVLLYKKGQRASKADIGVVGTIGPLLPVVLPPGRRIKISARLRDGTSSNRRISYG